MVGAPFTHAIIVSLTRLPTQSFISLASSTLSSSCFFAIKAGSVMLSAFICTATF